MSAPKEVWSSRLGVILAVAGSAVGLGNFLRFPGLAAQYGGGAFMIAYFISLLIIGIPIGWAEWALGRHGGSLGFRSSPGIFHALIKKPYGKYLGVIGFIIPVMIYMYYVYIEAWCLGYALNAATGQLSVPGMNYGEFFGRYTGAGSDGVALHFGLHDVGLFVLIVYAINFWFIYRGISKGIELVCKYAMPALIVIALIVLARVLTLGTPDPLKPDQNVLTGLGFMWNPGDISEGLKNPQLWLAAAGQIFFSLSVGFGVIITYSSYLTKKDDVVLSGLTASSANEFCEVGLGGLITVPAAFMFLGAAGIVGQGTFGLGFNVLPEVFARMPAGQVFATIFFILLFLAAVTSSLSMLQPGIAFLEEGLGIKRKASVALLGLVTAIGTGFVWYFSKDLKALDTLDFWVGTLLIFIQATILIIIFGWTVGIEKGWAILHEGSALRAPAFFKPIIKYVTPAFLLTIFVLFILKNVFGWNFSLGDAARFEPTSYVRDLVGPNPDKVARLSVLFIALMTLFTGILVHLAGKHWATHPRAESDKN
ncbi:sodium:calcium symporter [Nibricoccus aquaticus]|uniref:Sodium:calcium symporter n=1 Tax=Nibricoccus aquaticus TaxID=2576891 RepID=A0A290QFS0_9BACT|nr:sodium-dependent transporter [Nibricoccus aquaticus]ATC63201.1 sodium:calcium symporter [Nibricoccus aquaticus]